VTAGLPLSPGRKAGRGCAAATLFLLAACGVQGSRNDPSMSNATGQRTSPHLAYDAVAEVDGVAVTGSWKIPASEFYPTATSPLDPGIGRFLPVIGGPLSGLEVITSGQPPSGPSKLEQHFDYLAMPLSSGAALLIDVRSGREPAGWLVDSLREPQILTRVRNGKDCWRVKNCTASFTATPLSPGTEMLTGPGFALDGMPSDAFQRSFPNVTMQSIAFADLNALQVHLAEIAKVPGLEAAIAAAGELGVVMLPAPIWHAINPRKSGRAVPLIYRGGQRWALDDAPPILPARRYRMPLGAWQVSSGYDDVTRRRLQAAIAGEIEYERRVLRYPIGTIASGGVPALVDLRKGLLFTIDQPNFSVMTLVASTTPNSSSP
jgi:hypothetical protein